MTSNVKKRISSVLTMAAMLALTSVAYGNWTITDLGSLDGRTSHAVDLNNSGQVIGHSTYAGGGSSDYYPFIWENGAMTALPTINGAFEGRAEGINESGQVAGWSRTGTGTDMHACIWHNGSLNDLGTVGGNQTYAYGINNAGHAVGTQGYPEFAILWDGTTLSSLPPTNPNDYFPCAYDINDSGKVVGFGQVDGGAVHALLYDDGDCTDLGVLETGVMSKAVEISDAGLITGWSYNGETFRPGPGPIQRKVQHAFLWEEGTMTDLGTLGGYLSDGFDVNDAGQVVGKANYIEEDHINFHAFLWQDGQMIDLNDLLPDGSGWELKEARGINDLGHIVGYGTINGMDHAFLLVPEPGTLGCLLLGFSAVTLTRKRRQ